MVLALGIKPNLHKLTRTERGRAVQWNGSSPKSSSLGFGHAGEFPLGPIELLQGFPHGVGGATGKTADVIQDRCKSHADDLQVFVENLPVLGG